MRILTVVAAMLLTRLIREAFCSMPGAKTGVGGVL
jgi:hypothetical protein